MLNKQQKAQAEEMRQELAPLYKRAANLADKWIKANQIRRRFEDVATFWLYVGTGEEWKHGGTMTEAEKEQARNAKADRRAWHRELESIGNYETQAQNNERAAWFNYLNYLYYICDVVALKLAPLASALYNQRGDTFKEWAEIISPKAPKEYTARTVWTSIYLNHIFTDSIALDIHTNAGGACGAYSHKIRYYKLNEETPEEWKATPKEPQPMTGKQYADRLHKLGQYVKKAKEIQAEQRQKGAEWGLLGACEFLTYPTTETVRK